jgi:hypothetical protein
MLDRAACVPMRIALRPQVDVAALDALTRLLVEVAVAGAASSTIPVCDRTKWSPSQRESGETRMRCQCKVRQEFTIF